MSQPHPHPSQRTTTVMFVVGLVVETVAAWRALLYYRRNPGG